MMNRCSFIISYSHIAIGHYYNYYFVGTYFAGKYFHIGKKFDFNIGHWLHWELLFSPVVWYLPKSQECAYIEDQPFSHTKSCNDCSFEDSQVGITEGQSMSLYYYYGTQYSKATSDDCSTCPRLARNIREWNLLRPVAWAVGGWVRGFRPFSSQQTRRLSALQLARTIDYLPR